MLAIFWVIFFASPLLVRGAENPSIKNWEYPALGNQTIHVHYGEKGSSIRLPKWTTANLIRISQQPGLAALHRDLALLCQESPLASDASSAIPDCQAATIDINGAFRPIGRHHLIGLQRLPANRILLHTRDLQLLIRENSGKEIIIARSVAVPRISEDGTRVVFTQFNADVTTLEPGNVGKIICQDLKTGMTRIITEDPTASSAFLIPESEETIFLSARTGLASIWIASPGKPDRQITNVGAIRVDANFIPVYGNEVIWIPNTRLMVYTASYGNHTLWSLNLDTGKATPLGAGRMPQYHDKGLIQAVLDDHSKLPNVVQYSIKGMP